MQYENSYCEHDDEAYWLPSPLRPPQGVDDSEVMDEDLSFGEMYDTPKGLQMQIQAERSHFKINKKSAIVCNMKIHIVSMMMRPIFYFSMIILTYVSHTVWMTPE